MSIQRKRKRKRMNLQRQIALELKTLRYRTKNKRKHKDRNSNGYNNSSNHKKRNYNSELTKRFWDYKHIIAPEKFSLIKNETGVIEFQNKLQLCFDKRQKVLVRLENVNEMTTDAILILLSIMVRFRSENLDFNGTQPRDPLINSRLINSGFFSHLYDQNDLDQFNFKKIEGRIYTHGQKTVSSNLADDLVKFSSEKIWGEPRRCPGVQKTLIELMHNTFDHAGPDKGSRHWWISVESDSKSKQVTFSFLDYGVGIFRSLKNKKPGEPLYNAYEKLCNLFPFATTDYEKLRLILEDKIKLTQSGAYYRGKGLAKIFSHYKESRIGSLFILSNYASANPVNNDYHELVNEFTGTFISFTMDKNIKTLPWELKF